MDGLIFVGNHVTFPVLLAKLGYSFFNEKLKMVAIESSYDGPNKSRLPSLGVLLYSGHRYTTVSKYMILTVIIHNHWLFQ